MKSKTIRLIAAAATLAVMSLGGAQAATSQAVGAKSVLSGISAGAFSQAGSTPRVGAAAAGDLLINAAGVASFDGAGAPGNTTFTFSVAPGALVDAFAYNLSLATVGASWLSEATIAVLNSAGDGVVLSAGFGEDNSGTGTYADSVLLSDFGLAFNVGSDGLLFVEFYESFDDVANAIDANWTAGTITLGGIAAAVPEPSTYGLMTLGLFAVGAAARRRKA